MPLGSFRIAGGIARKLAAAAPAVLDLLITKNTSPYFEVYTNSSGSFVKLANPSSLPTSDLRCAEWNFDGSLIAVGNTITADKKVNVYQKLNGVLTKLTAPTTQPTSGWAYNISWHPTQNRFAAAAADGIYIYDVSGTTVTYATKISLSGIDSGCDLAWNHNGTSLAFTDIVNGAYLWNVSGNTFTLLTSFPSYTDLGNCMCWNHNGTTLVVGYESSPYIKIYNRVGDTFTRIETSLIGPSKLTDATFNHDGTKLACNFNYTPVIYNRSGNTFTDITPASMSYALTPVGNNGQHRGMSWNSTGSKFVIGSYTSPYLNMWDISGNTFTKITGPTQSGRITIASFSPGTLG